VLRLLRLLRLLRPSLPVDGFVINFLFFSAGLVPVPAFFLVYSQPSLPVPGRWKTCPRGEPSLPCLNQLDLRAKSPRKLLVIRPRVCPAACCISCWPDPRVVTCRASRNDRRASPAIKSAPRCQRQPAPPTCPSRGRRPGPALGLRRGLRRCREWEGPGRRRWRSLRRRAGSFVFIEFLELGAYDSFNVQRIFLPRIVRQENETDRSNHQRNYCRTANRSIDKRNKITPTANKHASIDDSS